MRYFAEALQSDVSDIQQGTTAEGVHLGAMAGTVDLVQRVSTGIEVTGDVLRLNPQLPQELERLDMRIRYRGHSLDLRLTRDALTVRGRDRGAAPIHLGIKNEVYGFAGSSLRIFKLRVQEGGVRARLRNREGGALAVHDRTHNDMEVGDTCPAVSQMKPESAPCATSGAPGGTPEPLEQQVLVNCLSPSIQPRCDCFSHM